jgi:hypothetical protein
VRHELLKAKADSKSALIQPEKPETDCTKTLLSYQVAAAEPQDKSKEKHVLQQSERSVSYTCSIRFPSSTCMHSRGLLAFSTFI